MRVSSVATLRGQIRPPSDKSLTHRAYMLAAAALSPSIVSEPLKGEDCQATLSCLQAMGLKSRWIADNRIELLPSKEWQQPDGELYCGNSGTTMRLLSGMIASRPLKVTLTGDESLSRRPMKRIAEPLRLMGAHVEGDTPPLKIQGGDLSGIRYKSPVASAQIKSCILLAGLRASGETWVIEPDLSRDHTERMLRALGVTVLGDPIDSSTTSVHNPLALLSKETAIADLAANRVGVKGGATWSGFEFCVPADISSAAFMMVAAAMLPESEVTLKDVGLNPTRIGILEVFKQAGVRWEATGSRNEMGEPVADISVYGGSTLKPFTIEGALVPRLIDEIPVLAVFATQCNGETIIKDAKELRVKESDRIESVCQSLVKMGAHVEALPDGMRIVGPTRLKGAKIEARNDHRIAMAFSIAGLVADGITEIEGAESIMTSYPEFEKDLERLIVV